MNSRTSPRRILFLAANPRDTTWLRLDEEAREIDEALHRAKLRDQFTIVQKWAVRIRDIRRAMLDEQPHIIHFSGHGETEGLVFENQSGQAQLIDLEALSELFGLFDDKIECVLLNSCYSARQAEAINRHIPYVIGMSKEIGDQAAIEFAVGFFDGLGAGRSFEDAFRLGCNAIHLQGISEHLTPILHQKPEHRSKASLKPPAARMIEAATVPALKKAVDFLFGDGRRIIQEAREHEPSEEQRAQVVRDELLRRRISEEAWSAHGSQVMHLQSLADIHTRNYRLAKKKLAMTGPVHAPPIALHELDAATNGVLQATTQLQATLGEVFGNTVVIPGLEEN